MKKTLIILTKSRKYGNYCVAGIDYNTSEWVRLINNGRKGGALSEEDLRTKDGRFCDILDVVEVECLDKEACSNYHPEDVYMDTSVPMKKVGHTTWKDIVERDIERKEDDRILNCLEGEERRTTYQISKLQKPASLQFLHVKNLYIERGDEAKTKARFTYRDCVYKNISVTDPEFELDESGSEYYKDAYLIVSRGLPWIHPLSKVEWHYTLVAKVILCCESDLRAA